MQTTSQMLSDFSIFTAGLGIFVNTLSAVQQAKWETIELVGLLFQLEEKMLKLGGHWNNEESILQVYFCHKGVPI